MGSLKKSLQLGVEFGTATHKLRKSLLFSFAKRLNLDSCYRCGKLIESVEDFSIDHKIVWLDSENPQELFFDLDNIAFSHLKCNVSARRKIKSVVKSGTGYKGVDFDGSCRHNKPYRAMLEVVLDGVKTRCFLGRFATPAEAALAYDKKANEVFGQEAVTNFKLGLVKNEWVAKEDRFGDLDK